MGRGKAAKKATPGRQGTLGVSVHPHIKKPSHVIGMQIGTDEIQRWKYITPEEINEFRCPDGLLNEFKMFWHLRHRFPLHFLVFKQIACRGADDGKLF